MFARNIIESICRAHLDRTVRMRRTRPRQGDNLLLFASEVSLGGGGVMKAGPTPETFLTGVRANTTGGRGSQRGPRRPPETCARREEKREKAEGGEKNCRRCGQTKRADLFPRNPRVSDGLSSWCRACHALACREHRERKRIERQRAERAQIEKNLAEIAERNEHYEGLDRRRKRDRARREQRGGDSAV